MGDQLRHRIDDQRLLEAARSQLADGLTGPRTVVRLKQLSKPRDVCDTIETFLALSEGDEPVAVIQVADPSAPLLVHRGMTTAKLVRQALGPDLGAAVIAPYGGGEFEGRSYAVWPWRRPLTQHGVLWRICRPRVRLAVRDWLRGCVRVASRGERSAQVRNRYREPLEHVVESNVFSKELRSIAERSLDRLATGRWCPVSVIDHNDLWRGNVHWNIDASGRRCGQSRFVIIDWNGANVEGSGFFDLVRWAGSTGMATAVLAREIAVHAEILGIDPRDAAGHLLATLGRLAVNREQFPLDRLEKLVEATWARFASAAP